MPAAIKWKSLEIVAEVEKWKWALSSYDSWFDVFTSLSRSAACSGKCQPASSYCKGIYQLGVRLQDFDAVKCGKSVMKFCGNPGVYKFVHLQRKHWQKSTDWSPRFAYFFRNFAVHFFSLCIYIDFDFVNFLMLYVPWILCASIEAIYLYIIGFKV